MSLLEFEWERTKRHFTNPSNKKTKNSRFFFIQISLHHLEGRRSGIDLRDGEVGRTPVTVVVQAVRSRIAQLSDEPLEGHVLLEGLGVGDRRPVELGLPVSVGAVNGPVARDELLNVKERGAALEIVAGIAAPEGGLGGLASRVRGGNV